MYPTIFFTFILALILFYISKEDIETMKLSETKLKIFGLAGIFYLIYLGLSTKNINTIYLILNNFLSMLIIYIVMYSISLIASKFFRINSLGLGDVKLSSISSIWLGIEFTFLSLCISFLLSATYTIHGKITKRFKTLHQYPFAPFLSIGIFCSWILDKI
tara:strand:+ start:281 stop:760 length:480 start_codon:yes stop_codon:yes gene_type:complete